MTEVIERACAPVDAPALPADAAALLRSSSFYWGMRLLEPHRRAGMFTVYAFCRAVDDIADEGGTLEAKQAGLAVWRRDIDALYAGRMPAQPLARLLAGPIDAFALRKADFEAVIDGMAMDAAGDIQAPSLAELDLYCDRVASAVGRLSVRVFGDASEAADVVAHHLGRALQLTNILRDIAEDADRGRLYLPREILERHGITTATATPLDVLNHASLGAACLEVAALAHQHFAGASAALKRCDAKAMRPAGLMRAFYETILTRLVKSQWKNPRVRVRLSKPLKLWLVVRHGLL